MTNETASEYDQTKLDNLKKRIDMRFRDWSYYKSKYRGRHFKITGLIILVSMINVVSSGLPTIYKNSNSIALISLIVSAILLGLNSIQSLISANEMHSYNAQALNSLIDLNFRLKRLKEYNILSNEKIKEFEDELRQLEKTFFTSIIKLPEI